MVLSACHSLGKNHAVCRAQLKHHLLQEASLPTDAQLYAPSKGAATDVLLPFNTHGFSQSFNKCLLSTYYVFDL